MGSPEVRILCDHMLGSLAKWLRLLGYDTLYPGPLDDREIAAKAYDEGRVLLTRDKDLAARVRGSVFVVSDDIDRQLKSVVEALHLDLPNTFSRCSVCNSLIMEIDRTEAAEKVPPKVLEVQERFWRCPSCSRVYWQGSHWTDMLGRIEKLKSEPDHSPV